MPPKKPFFVDNRGQICDSTGKVWGHMYFPGAVSRPTLNEHMIEAPDAPADPEPPVD